jgi:hypothetical protein
MAHAHVLVISAERRCGIVAAAGHEPALFQQQTPVSIHILEIKDRP